MSRSPPSRSWTPWLRPPEISERWHSLLRNPSCPEALLCCTLRGGAKASSGRPHRQVHTVKGKGRRKRRSNNTRNGSKSNLDTRWMGIAVKGTELNGPLCDLTCSCTASEAIFCHPWLTWQGSRSCSCGPGLNPSARASPGCRDLPPAISHLTPQQQPCDHVPSSFL